MKHYTVPAGIYTVKHYIVGEMRLDGTAGPATVTEVCTTHWAAGVCSCGVYLLLWMPL